MGSAGVGAAFSPPARTLWTGIGVFVLAYLVSLAVARSNGPDLVGGRSQRPRSRSCRGWKDVLYTGLHFILPIVVLLLLRHGGAPVAAALGILGGLGDDLHRADAAPAESR